MMKGLGHTVYLYAGDENEAQVDEHISCISETQRRIVVGNKPYVEAPFDYRLPHWQKFNKKAAAEIKKRAEKHDFICVIGGASHKPIADALPNMMTVEFGVGYAGVFAQYRVYESYAWMHAIYAQHKNAAQVDGSFFDAVIPGYLDPDMFPMGKGDGDYYLYVGRMIPRKGIDIAAHICKTIGARLIFAGPGCRNVEEFILATQNVKNLDRQAIRDRAISLYSVDVIAKQYEYYFQRLMTLWEDGWYTEGNNANTKRDGG